MYKIIFVLCLCVVAVLTKHEIYEGHTLYNVIVNDVDQAMLVNKLENQMEIDMWARAMPDRPGQVLVSKEHKEEFLNALDNAGVAYSIETENIKECLDLEDEMLAAAAAQTSNRSSIGLDFDTIHRYDVVDRYLVELAERFPETVTVASGGRSFNGLDIKYLKISTTNFQDDRKPVMMVQSLLHAREWITLPVTLYAIEKLVIDITDRDLVEDIDWIIMPIVNPDGYEWSHTNARFWRKNRRDGLTPGNICMGVDLNRNFDAFWSTASSNNPCTDTFHGASAFSEPEVAIIRDILSPYTHRLELYLDIHSYGSMILFGFGTGELAPNALQLILGGVPMAEAIDRVKWPQNRNYVVGNIVAVLGYFASGGSSDWAQLHGATLSYTYELPAYRNMGCLNGFLVEDAFIRQAGFETWEGIKAGARHAASRFYSRLAEKEAILRGGD